MKKQIMKRAWEMYKAAGCTTRHEFGIALKAAWAETRDVKVYKNVTIATFEEYNSRRYSNPWVAIVNDSGRLDFGMKVGAYTGRYNSGEAGELYVFAPVEGQVYGYGRKDYRGGNTMVNYAVFKSGSFVLCDKLGHVA